MTTPAAAMTTPAAAMTTPAAAMTTEIATIEAWNAAHDWSEFVVSGRSRSATQLAIEHDRAGELRGLRKALRIVEGGK